MKRFDTCTDDALCMTEHHQELVQWMRRPCPSWTPVVLRMWRVLQCWPRLPPPSRVPLPRRVKFRAASTVKKEHQPAQADGGG